ncbi:hypothetical protein [Leifsonia xyli]|uniref:hypothetical protein n=1 Tax=Leifsonia xyli TaxID=1575 RepID=UPI00114D06C0|nr:hypothetical protein [Leifsonia xyli]
MNDEAKGRTEEAVANLVWIICQDESPHNTVLGVFANEAQASQFAEEVRSEFANGVIYSSFPIGFRYDRGSGHVAAEFVDEFVRGVDASVAVVSEESGDLSTVLDGVLRGGDFVAALLPFGDNLLCEGDSLVSLLVPRAAQAADRRRVRKRFR